MNTTVDNVISILINEGVIPVSDTFGITEVMLNRYCQLYRDLKNDTGWKPKHPSQIRFQRKMAGIMLAKENQKRISQKPPKVIESSMTLSKTSKSGFLYVVSNPAFSGFYKIGITTDLKSRLKTYQTGDPLRRYQYERTSFVLDRREAEKLVLSEFSIDIRHGEWISDEKLLDKFHIILDNIQKTITDKESRK